MHKTKQLLLNRIMAVLLVLFMLLPSMSVFAVSGSTVSIGTASGQPGDQVSVTVSVSGNPGIAYLKLKIGYDASQLTLTGATNSGLLSGTFTTSKTTDTNPYVLQWMGAENATGNGVAATLTFQIASNASAGDKSISVTVDECYNESFDDVTISPSNGKVTVEDNADTTKPTGSISSTNNVSTTQTVTLKMSDNVGVVSYYWGTSSSPSSSSYTSITSTTSTTVTKTVSSAGTYYLIAKDAAGNTATTSKTFYKTTLDANGGSVSPSYVITMSGNTVTLPTPTNGDATFIGWGTSTTATSGVESITVSLSKTYYAVWETTTIGGECGNDVYWNLDDNVLWIAGSGEMWNWSETDKSPWSEYSEQIWYVKILDDVTNVGEYAFYNCIKLLHVYIADATKIENHAFDGCSNLNELYLPNCLEVVGNSAFKKCKGITSVTLPSSVTEIGQYAFGECSNLDDISILSENIEIGMDAFSYTAYYNNFDNWDENCDYLYVDDERFIVLTRGYAGEFTLKDGTKTIASSAFEGCTKLSYITIPESVVDINSAAFHGCSSLTQVDIPNSVTELKEYCFARCDSLTKVVIPASVTNIDSTTFMYSENVIIYGYTNSYAEHYANTYDIEFVAIDRIYVDDIFVSNNPTKTTYYIGDTLNTSGLQLSVSYSDGTTETITSGFTTSGFSSTTAGTKTVTVSYEGFTDTFTVTVKTPSITLSSSSKTISVGDTSTITATTTPSGQTITWTSSNTGVATVSGGTITAKTAGTATITAKFTYNGITYSKTCSVTVSNPVVTISSISVYTNPTKTNYYIGDSLNTSGLVLRLTYSDGSTETVSSGFTTSGFSSTSAGTKTVIVSYEGETTTFTVTINTPSISLSSTSKSMTVGGTATLTATTTPSGQTVTWASSDTSVATVSNGIITAKSAGTATITAKFTYNGIVYSNTCMLTVKDNVLIGDVNGDGRINNKDLGLLMQKLNGWDVEISDAVADVNADGKVNNKDYGLLMQYVNGWDVEIG